MEMIEATRHLKNDAANKLVTEVNNHKLGVCVISEYRQASLVDYSKEFDAAGYLGWLRERNIRIKLVEQDPKGQSGAKDSELGIGSDEARRRDNIRYIKIVDQPRKRELPKPLLALLIRKLKEKILNQEEENLDWKGSGLTGGMLFVLYEVPANTSPSRQHRTISLFLPEKDEDEVVLVDHLRKPQGFKDKLKSLNPFDRLYERDNITETAQLEDIQAINKMVASCNVYDHADLVRKELIPL